MGWRGVVAGLASDRPQLAGRSRLGAVCESLGQWPVMAVQCGLKHLVVWSIILSRGPLLKEVCAGPSVRIRRRDLPAMSTRSSARRPRQHDHPQCPSANPRRCRPDERAHLCIRRRPIALVYVLPVLALCCTGTTDPRRPRQQAPKLSPRPYPLPPRPPAFPDSLLASACGKSEPPVGHQLLPAPARP